MLDQILTQGLSSLDRYRSNGIVEKVVGVSIEARGPLAEIGEFCQIEVPSRGLIDAEVVGFHGEHTILMPLGPLGGVKPGCRVIASGRSISVPAGDALLGRVINALGRPIDGKPLPLDVETAPLYRTPPAALERRRISEQLPLGVRAIDAFLPCGQGQRMGIFAGSGVGKSSLMGMIARATEADINVIGLVGERGREVREFIERDLGEEGLARSVVVVATSDEPALVRLKAALAATAIAERFRDQGKNVLLLVDSLTRFATAQREIGLAAGEPPTNRGYPPSMYAMLPQLLERAGAVSHGSITGLYTVLVEGDDMNEPVADTARSILDGHIVLTRDLAHRGHFPSIDILQSISRLESELSPPDVRFAAREIRRLLAAYRENEDFITIGAYQHGSKPEVDRAISLMPSIDDFLRQGLENPSTLAEARLRLQALAPDLARALLESAALAAE